MPDTKLLPQLIERLLELTAAGKIDWEQTASEDDFQAAVRQYIVAISRTGADYGEWDYSIRVADRKGTLLDEADATDFGRELTIAGETPYKALSLLFDGARRKALNVGEALNKLLASLDSLEH